MTPGWGVLLPQNEARETHLAQQQQNEAQSTAEGRYRKKLEEEEKKAQEAPATATLADENEKLRQRISQMEQMNISEFWKTMGKGAGKTV